MEMQREKGRIMSDGRKWDLSHVRHIRTFSQKWSSLHLQINKSLYIYIYIKEQPLLYVCVCVCACPRLVSSFERGRLCHFGAKKRPILAPLCEANFCHFGAKWPISVQMRALSAKRVESAKCVFGWVRLGQDLVTHFRHFTFLLLFLSNEVSD